MMVNLRNLPIEKRIELVEDIWDSIATDNAALPLTNEQREELDRRLNAYESDGVKGRLASEAIVDIRKRL
ncbi:MAG: addiction module protein [Candidatus Anammoxibacter sp.]